MACNKNYLDTNVDDLIKFIRNAPTHILPMKTNYIRHEVFETDVEYLKKQAEKLASVTQNLRLEYQQLALEKKELELIDKRMKAFNL
jgi:hypothetical protein